MLVDYYRRLTLRFSKNANVIYGFPPSAKSFPEPGWLYLNNPPQAVRDYVPGSCRRERLTTKRGKSPSASATYIPIPPDDAEEGRHCLLMKRCGAIYKESSDILEEMDRPMQGSEKQIFGWPSEGGVWVFRLPQSLLRWPFGDDQFRSGDMQIELMSRSDEEGWDEQKSLLDSKLRAQEDMDGYCEVLKDYGAQYYTDINECPEIHTLGLIEPVMQPNIWIPPRTPGAKWRPNPPHGDQAETQEPN